MHAGSVKARWKPDTFPIERKAKYFSSRGIAASLKRTGSAASNSGGGRIRRSRRIVAQRADMSRRTLIRAGEPPSREELLRQCLLDLRLEHAIEVGLGDRADQLVGDIAVAADDEAFRHAVDAPFHRGAAIAVGAGRREWIAIAP